MTPWKNVWVDYIKKYFKDKDIKVDFNVSYQINLHEMHKYEVAVFCWCDNNVIRLSKLPVKYCKRYIVFVRSYEIFFGYTNDVAWNNIDDVIFVNYEFYKEFKAKLRDFKCRVHYLPNAIDLDKWGFQEHNKGFNIAMVCNLSHKKGIDQIPQFIYQLQKYDKRYNLHIAGRHDEARHTLYIKHIIKEMGLKDKVHFYGKVDDIQKFLSDKDYLFTCSVTEGHPNNVIEAMALGIKTIVHNWIGSKDNFPKELIWTDIDRAVNLVLEDTYDSSYYRRYAEDNFDMNKIYPNLEKILKC